MYRAVVILLFCCASLFSADLSPESFTYSGDAELPAKSTYVTIIDSTPVSPFDLRKLHPREVLLYYSYDYKKVLLFTCVQGQDFKKLSFFPYPSNTTLKEALTRSYYKEENLNPGQYEPLLYFTTKGIYSDRTVLCYQDTNKNWIKLHQPEVKPEIKVVTKKVIVEKKKHKTYYTYPLKGMHVRLKAATVLGGGNVDLSTGPEFVVRFWKRPLSFSFGYTMESITNQTYSFSRFDRYEEVYLPDQHIIDSTTGKHVIIEGDTLINTVSLVGEEEVTKTHSWSSLLSIKKRVSFGGGLLFSRIKTNGHHKGSLEPHPVEYFKLDTVYNKVGYFGEIQLRFPLHLYARSGVFMDKLYLDTSVGFTPFDSKVFVINIGYKQILSHKAGYAGIIFDFSELYPYLE